MQVETTLETQALNWLHQHSGKPVAYLNTSGKKTRLSNSKDGSDGSPCYWCKTENNPDGSTALHIRFSTFAHGGYTEQTSFVLSPDNTINTSTTERTAHTSKQPNTDKDSLLKAAYAKAQTELEASAADGHSPYLERKNVSQFAARASGLRYGHNAIFLPFHDIEGKPQGFQRIADNGFKKVFGKLKGHFAVVGEMPEHKKHGVVWIVEGLSTGLSVYAATQQCVVVAFNASNIEAVAYALRSRDETLTINIAADNDAYDKHGKPRPDLNPGLEKAHKTAFYVKHCNIFAPTQVKAGYSDFNDMHCEHGLQAVTDALQYVHALPLDTRMAFAHELRKQAKREAKNTNAQNSRYVSLEAKEGITFVKSAKSTGKTYALKTVLKGSKSALYVSHLISLAEDAAKRLDMDVYLDADQMGLHVSDFSHLSICVNSLHKLSMDKDVQQYEYLVIDEIEQLLQRLCTSIDYKPLILATLIYLIKNAKHVVLLDADLGTLTRDFINNVAPNRQQHNITNHFKPAQDFNMTMYPHEGELINEAVKAIEKGQRVFVTANSKGAARRVFNDLKRAAPKADGLYISGDNSGDADVKAFFKNPNEEAKLYQFVVTTPAANTGISIDAINGQAAFDFVGGIFKVNINAPSDALQAISRVRECKQLHVYVERKANPPGRNKNDILLALTNRQYANKEFGLDAAESEINEHGQRVPKTDTIYTQLYANVASYRDWARFRFYESFIKQATLEGYTFDFADDTGLGTETLKRAKDLEDSEYLDRILNADDIIEADAEKMRRRNRLTMSETDSLTRFDLKRFYGDSLGGLVETIEFDKRGQMRKNIKRLEQSFLTDAQIDELNTKQKNALTADKVNYRLRREFNLKLLNIAGIDSNARYTETTYTANSQPVIEFAQYCEANKGALQELVKIPQSLQTNPVKFIGEQLRRLGIKQKRTGDSANRRYGLDEKQWLRVGGVLSYRVSTDFDTEDTRHTSSFFIKDEVCLVKGVSGVSGAPGVSGVSFDQLAPPSQTLSILAELHKNRGSLDKSSLKAFATEILQNLADDDPGLEPLWLATAGFVTESLSSVQQLLHEAQGKICEQYQLEPLF